MKQSFWKFFFLIWLVCISNASHALEVIEILGGKASQIPVAVIPFKDNNAQKRIVLDYSAPLISPVFQITRLMSEK